MNLSRRTWLLSSAALAAGTEALAQAAPKPIVISSQNGQAACQRAFERMRAGADTLDAVIAGVNIVELDPNDDSVGYGGLPNEEGVVELDASVIHGPSRRCGSVAGIRNIKTPSLVAQRVMQETDHIMLAGDGALKFAREMGFPEDNLLTERSRQAWLVWKKSQRDSAGHTNWSGEFTAPPATRSSAEWQRLFPNIDAATLAYAVDRALHPPTGTINCLALNAKGEMSGCTTTSGLAWKIPGRIGDSPIIGAGLYLDQDVGGAGSTGRGEENIRIAGGHTIVENMRHGMTPAEACLDALRRIARNFNNDRSHLEKFYVKFYALRKDGAYAGACLWDKNGRGVQETFAVNDGGESRLEPCVSLLKR